MRKNHNTLAFVIGSTLVAGLSAATAQAQTLESNNAFQLTELSSGYMQLAEATTTTTPAAAPAAAGKTKEAKEMTCGEGKCGANKKAGAKPTEVKKGKAMEGKCAGMKAEPAAPTAPSKPAATPTEPAK